MCSFVYLIYKSKMRSRDIGRVTSDVQANPPLVVGGGLGGWLDPPPLCVVLSYEILTSFYLK